jgi:DNA-binding NarL/FixJ family response regulator
MTTLDRVAELEHDRNSRRRLRRLPITPRELEVLRRVSFGWSNVEIATDLGISAETVRTHVQNTLRGLGARNRAHAVGIALRTGGLA